ncbi:putative kinase [Paraburkholderia bannensis]|uniref:Putative kinase n=1 Tax=Paraburkholderia bannensis TaxID=765414 RepID=A0A7W9TUF6_9BURK|nr:MULTISPECIES: ATP-binding protein [Paraburkholderia]MBB3256649.1 putative kinase [Paraburkholderia sp. WP4_3_2]MBB6101648.1 putative kinase [Paraburkholderia bannensis]
MTRLVFFCGHAGTGKTSLAKHLIGPLARATGEPFCLLDKDTLYGRTGAATLAALGQDPHDRDSPLFLHHLRDPEYQGMLDTARENLALGVSVLAVGPLSREVRERRLLDRQWLGVAEDVALAAVWVCADEQTAQQRIVARAHPGDDWKLAHWDEYRQRRFEPEGAQRDDLIVFDTTAPTQADYDALLQRLAGAS